MIFAGTAVAIALLALFVVGTELVAAIGVAGAIVVFSAVLVATRLLPALLGMAGPRRPLAHPTAPLHWWRDGTGV